MAKSKTRVPKRIGGVKVPKKVRKQAKKAIKLVEAPVRDFAISGLTAAAEALAKRTATELRAAGDTQRRTSLAALDLGDMLREAAIEGARRFLAGFEEATKAASAAQPARGNAARATKRTAATAKPRAASRTKASAAKPRATARPKPAAKPKAGAAKSPAKPAAKPAARKPSGRPARKPTGGADAP